jgi:hypothetical protein
MTQGAEHGPGSAAHFVTGSGPDATESAKAPKGWAIAGQVTWSDHSGRHDSQPRHEP